MDNDLCECVCHKLFFLKWFLWKITWQIYFEIILKIIILCMRFQHINIENSNQDLAAERTYWVWWNVEISYSSWCLTHKETEMSPLQGWSERGAFGLQRFRPYRAKGREGLSGYRDVAPTGLGRGRMGKISTWRSRFFMIVVLNNPVRPSHIFQRLYDHCRWCCIW